MDRTTTPSPADLPPAAAAADPAAPRWTVRLLGAVEARGTSGALGRWPSRAVALLLARLALMPDRVHPREELVELLWPGVSLEVGRNRLRQALSTLKSLLEPAGAPAVIVADRQAVRSVAGALVCDACDFEASLRAGDWEQAERLYRGELLPGFYDEWVLQERGRLAALAERLQAMPRLPAAAAAPQAPAAAAPGRLPSYWTRLFGTEITATRLRELVRRERLVTVLGAGGSGKTRLAVEAARACLDAAAWRPDAADEGSDFDQVVFVSLIDCTDAQRALEAVAAALQAGGRDPMQAIVQMLAGQRTLLVLDNFEQLAGRADGLVQGLLTETPTLHLLITSRQRLAIDGEHVFELAGLAVPAAHARPGRHDDGGTAHAAVALFVDRARAAAPDFASGPPHDAAIADLVRLLAGMPLAIELAASRMRSLSPAELLALLSQGDTPMLDLLARDDAAPGMAQRHASMRHVVAWSWQQLGAALVQAMQALSVFAEPASAATVGAVAGIDPRLARDRLEQLRDHSLVVAHKPEGGAPRYVLLQPVREFVVERTHADDLARLRERLRRWLIDFGRRSAARGHAALAEVGLELPHVYAAILGAAADGPAAQRQAVELAVVLRRHWEIDTRAGLPAPVMQAVHDALVHVEDRDLHTEACVLLTFSNVLAGAPAEALALSEQALAGATQPGLRAHAQIRRVQALMFSASDQSGVGPMIAEALASATAAGDLEAQALALRMQFLVAVNRDDDRQLGERLATQAQALWERLGHRRNAYSGLMDRASCWIGLGRLDEAATALAACERVAREEQYATGYIMSSWQLGRVQLRLRRAEPALAAFRRCLQGSWDHKRLAYVADALVLLPGGLAFAGQPEAAARLMGFATPHWQRRFGSFYRDLERDVRPTRRWLRQRLGAAGFETLRLEGATMSLPEAVALGLSA